MPKTNEVRRAEWQRRGYLQKGRSGKMVEAFGLLLCVIKNRGRYSNPLTSLTEKESD